MWLKEKFFKYKEYILYNYVQSYNLRTKEELKKEFPDFIYSDLVFYEDQNTCIYKGYKNNFIEFLFTFEERLIIGYNSDYELSCILFFLYNASLLNRIKEEHLVHGDFYPCRIQIQDFVCYCLDHSILCHSDLNECINIKFNSEMGFVNFYRNYVGLTNTDLILRRNSPIKNNLSLKKIKDKKALFSYIKNGNDIELIKKFLHSFFDVEVW